MYCSFYVTNHAKLGTKTQVYVTTLSTTNPDNKNKEEKFHLQWCRPKPKSIVEFYIVSLLQPLLDKHKQDNLNNTNANQQFYIFNRPKLFWSPDDKFDSSVVSSSSSYFSSSSSVVSSSSAASSVAFALYPKPVLALAVVTVAVFSLHAAVAVFLTLKQSVSILWCRNSFLETK